MYMPVKYENKDHKNCGELEINTNYNSYLLKLPYIRQNCYLKKSSNEIIYHYLQNNSNKQ